MRRGWPLPLPALIVGVLLTAACTTHHTQHAAMHPAPSVAPSPVALSVAPATGTVNAPVTTEITTKVTNGHVTGVTLVDGHGQAVAGAMRPDGSSWVPAQPLDFQQRYTASVSAAGAAGSTSHTTTTFTTMANPGSDRIGTGMYLQNGVSYGVGMPVVVEFDAPIADQYKAQVERRLFVQSNPPQVGVWKWYGDRQVLYRPKGYWQPGTTLTVRAALGGLPVGNRYVDTDRSAVATIGPSQSFVVSNKTKTLYAYENGNLVKSFPVSLGKASTPTSSGNFVLMSHDYTTLFKTSEYSLIAYYDERFTWDGQYLHAAPWSVGDQGADNVSHGCVNLSTSDAQWIYQHSMVGDPLTVEGTEVHLSPGDGWTVWDESWSEYVKGSALPHPELLTGARGAN
jgi:lipoprotein-anchoring transpeptidase ErfK/SrfK